MKFFILAALVAVAAAGAIPYGYVGQATPAKEEPKYASITKHEDVRNLDGSSSYSYESSDKLTMQESQYQKQVGSATGTAAQGSSSYIAPDGQKIQMSWVADENGYRATGDHLPTPPPVPAEISAMLPTLPKLSFEQLYGAPAAMAPQAAYEAPKYESPKYDEPMYADAPMYEAPKIEMPRYEAPRVEAPKVATPAVVIPVAPVYEAPRHQAPAAPAPVAPMIPSYDAPKMETPKYVAPAPVAPAAPAQATYMRSY